MRPLKTILTALIAFNLAATAHAALKVGDVFPDLKSFQLEGRLPEDMKGKVVLVDFWASWCPPCLESFPVMDGLQKKYAGRGLVIIAINEDEDAADQNHFLKRHPASFTVVRDVGQKLIAAIDAPKMPCSFILDGEGRVRFIHPGFRGDETRKEYEKQIESLLTKK